MTGISRRRLIQVASLATVTSAAPARALGHLPIKETLVKDAPSRRSVQPLAVVHRFIQAVVGKHFREAAALLSQDALFVNGTIGIAHGRDGIIAVLEPILSMMDEIEWRIEHQAAEKGIVFTERTDRFRRGEKWAEIPATGVFEVAADGLIFHWREYFDAAAGTAALNTLSP